MLHEGSSGSELRGYQRSPKATANLVTPLWSEVEGR